MELPVNCWLDSTETIVGKHYFHIIRLYVYRFHTRTHQRRSVAFSSSVIIFQNHQSRSFLKRRNISDVIGSQKPIVCFGLKEANRTVFLHPGERLDPRKHLGQFSHPFRSLFLIALPFQLLFSQHLLEHLDDTKTAWCYMVLLNISF